MKRLNILIIAHELSPYQGSECSVGWNIVTNLSRFHNLYVLYAKTNQFNTSNYQDSIDDYFSTHNKIDGLELIPIEQPRKTKTFVRLNNMVRSANSSIGFAPFFYYGYQCWQKSAYHLASKLIKDKDIDIVHQLTAISFREPGYLWKFDVPFFWGPCSGMVKIPSSFYDTLTIKQISFELIRRVANYFQSHFSPRINKAISKASVVYTVTRDDYNFFSRKSKFVIRQMLDVGTFENQMPPQVLKNKSNKLQLLWIGRLVYTKALDILLFALGKDRELNSNIELTIIGDGPLFNHYQKIAQELNLSNINWLGNIPHDKVFDEIQISDLLVHTSIKEATSAVILEALTFGLPVICHDAFGMSFAVNESCGIKVPLISRAVSIVEFNKSIKKVLKDKSILRELSIGAQYRSKELSWESMSRIIASDYVKVITRQ